MPSVVGTSINGFATSAPHQRKSFYAKGRHWVFYSDGTNIVFSSSIDGVTWASPTVVRGAPDGEGSGFSVCFDGNYIHYAYGGYQTPLYYRRGTANSDGTITWSAVEQTALATASDYWMYPTIAVDSDGYPFIVYRFNIVATPYQYVTKSSTNDGTWTTAAGFPYELIQAEGYASVLSLTNGKIYVVFGNQALTMKGWLWDGSAWSTMETASTSNLYSDLRWSALSVGDDVHMLFLKQTTYDLIYVKRTYGVGWSGETTVQAATGDSVPPVISVDPSTGILYCFWAGSPTANHIYYKKNVAGTWNAGPTDWIDESIQVLTGNSRLTSFFQAYSNYIGLVYMTLTASPYNVKFAFLTGIPKPKGMIAIHAKLTGII